MPSLNTPLRSVLRTQTLSSRPLQSGRTFHTNHSNSNSKNAGVEPTDVLILGAARTPTGSFQGMLASFTATKLGSLAIRGVLAQAGVNPEEVREVLMGNVVSAGLGQSPARQASLGAGVPLGTDVTTINKVCASGMKALTLAAQGLAFDTAEMIKHSSSDKSVLSTERFAVVAGGMESMSNVPFYFPRGARYGNQTAADGIILDGLWDAKHNVHMGNCGENTAKKLGITREEQDQYALESYTLAGKAISSGAFKSEVVPVEITDRRTKKVKQLVDDEEALKATDLTKLQGLRPAFDAKNGTITAGNASPLSDGASAVVLTSQHLLDAHNSAKAGNSPVKPLARILGFADAALDPIDFPIAPTDAIKKALERASLRVGRTLDINSDVAAIEINEAFSVVGVANIKLLGIKDRSKVNAKGGAVALGHPIGSSGARIVGTLVHQLAKGDIGIAAICNGGGAATAVVVERL